MSIESLLSQVSEISKKYDEINKNTGGYFNVFEITNIAADELRICRLLYELLRPDGSHCQGVAYLELFNEHVLHIDNLEKTDLDSARVYREYRVDNKRRIDLVIEAKSLIIPIEVKIFAGDQPNQCCDYLKKAVGSNVYYLTLYGAPPSKESAGDLVPDGEGYKGVTQISFASDILHWVEACLVNTNTKNIASIREVLKQFADLIRKLTNQMTEDKIVDIKSILKKDIKSAFEIEEGVRSLKNDMLFKVLSSIEKRLDIGYEKVNNSKYDYTFNKGRIWNYYQSKAESTYPGFSYKVGKIKNRVELWLRVEIRQDIYVGLCTPVNGEDRGNQLSKAEIKKRYPKIAIDNKPDNVDGWWIYYEMLPLADVVESPNFRDFNDEYYKLYDDEAFEIFLNDSISTIKTLIGRIN